MGANTFKFQSLDTTQKSKKIWTEPLRF